MISSRNTRPWLAAIIAVLAAPALGAVGAAHAAPGLDLSPYRGKVVYLDFWASWCAPCRQSFAWMEDAQWTYRQRGLVIVAVDVDHDRSAAGRFLQDHPADFKIIYDPTGQVASQYKVKGMPMSFVIGRDGKIRSSHIGFFENQEDVYASQINDAISDRAP